MSDARDPADAGMDNPPNPAYQFRTGPGKSGADDAAGLLNSLTAAETHIKYLEHEVERLKAEVNHHAGQPIYMYAWGGGKK